MKHVIWAVDTFPDKKNGQSHMIDLLRSLGAEEKLVIEPVYVLSADQVYSMSDNSVPFDWLKDYKPLAQKALLTALKGVKLPGMKEPRILFEENPSIRASVDRLIAHAKSEGADAIAVSTHARKGLSRMVLGSFAETLLIHSDIPVLLANPKSKLSKRIRRILFPTDFGKYSRKAFERVVDFAKDHEAEITLFHKVINPIEPVFASGMYLLGGAWIPAQEYFDDQAEIREKTIEEWIGYGKQRGVEVHSIVDLKGGTISESALKAAKTEKADMIATASQSNALTSTLLGSVVRQLVRNSAFPMWVVHPKHSASKKKPHPPLKDSTLF